jgi:hypothetical protein
MEQQQLQQEPSLTENATTTTPISSYRVQIVQATAFDPLAYIIKAIVNAEDLDKQHTIMTQLQKMDLYDGVHAYKAPVFVKGFTLNPTLVQTLQADHVKVTTNDRFTNMVIRPPGSTCNASELIVVELWRKDAFVGDCRPTLSFEVRNPVFDLCLVKHALPTPYNP